MEFRSRHEAIGASADREFPVAGTARFGQLLRMTTLAEIEQAAVALAPAQQQELILFPAARLRAI